MDQVWGRPASKIVFVFMKSTSIKISERLNHIWGLRAQTTPKKDNSMDAESVQKTLKILNLATTINIFFISSLIFQKLGS